MKIITLNFRGTGNNVFVRNCKELIRRESPDAICLLETKADWGMGSKLARRFRFDSFFLKWPPLVMLVASFSYGILLPFIWIFLRVRTSVFTLRSLGMGLSFSPLS